MNGKDYLVDTNILIKLFDGNTDLINLLDEQNIFISFITEMELLSKPNLTKSQIVIVKNLIRDLFLINMNEDIKALAIQIRRNYRVKLPDAIIAATGIYLNIPLITMDRDFQSIEKLKMVSLKF